MGCHLPADLIMEIHARLPLNSQARFRCVCKDWHSSLTNPEFTTNHVIRAQENPNYQKVVCFRIKSSLYKVNFERYDTPYDKTTMFDVNPEINKKIALPRENPQVLPYTIIGSCNGLIFLSYGIQKFYLLNPLTGESRQLYNFSVKPKTKFAFGYDSSTRDYKIIRFEPDEPYSDLWVFSLKNNSWRCLKPNIQDIPKQLIPDLKTHQAVEVGGFLHWQVDSRNHDRVLTFDLAQEKFGELINLPKDPNEEARIIGLSVLHGCLCVTRKSIANMAQGCSIWTMKEYGVAESWTKLIILKALGLDWTYFSDSRFFPICYIKKGRVLLLQNVNKIILYDLEKESFTYSEIPVTVEERASWLLAAGEYEGMVPLEERLSWLLARGYI
ncbi:hypothetical protein COLO4_14581 [Corchorus olitorius]|uniref:F-box domain-containing protein n=1 Tax=Corchorus olitorius TaxID=93759 RepID=A0A1R3JRH4_9ROSI|nr:hypothetical protein COLO4_14581 [Corchorus olitorius]